MSFGVVAYCYCSSSMDIFYSICLDASESSSKWQTQLQISAARHVCSGQSWQRIQPHPAASSHKSNLKMSKQGAQIPEPWLILTCNRTEKLKVPRGWGRLFQTEFSKVGLVDP